MTPTEPVTPLHAAPEPKKTDPPLKTLSRFSKTYHAWTATLAGSALFTGTWLFATTSSLENADKSSIIGLTLPIMTLVPFAILTGYNLYDLGKRRAEDRVGRPVKTRRFAFKRTAPLDVPAQKTLKQPLSASVKTSLAEKEHTAILRSGIRHMERHLYDRLTLLENQDEATLALLADKQDLHLPELTESERAAFLAGEKSRIGRELERIAFMRQDINRLLGQGADPYAVWLDTLTAKEAAASRPESS